MEKKHSRYREAVTYVPLKKIFRTMKLTLFVVLLSAVQILANSVYSQSTKFTLARENVTIENVLGTIEDQSEFYFLYNGKLVDVTQKVNIKVEKQNLENTLNELLRNTNITYKIYDRQVVLSPVGTIETNQQQKSVSGKVTDSSGSPLPGVSVVLKGTTTGVITDANGNYSLSNIPENAIVQFSFVGMKMQEIIVAGKTTINVTLAEEAIGLDEVVAVGYGTVTRKEVTGAIGSVKSDDFMDGLAMAPEQLLNGKIAGVSIVQSSGEPGAASTVRIRGNSSISAGNDPLYVIDGVPLQFGSPKTSFINNKVASPNSQSNPLNMINASDIESIDVLKDASATAIYGSRGANGVIIITTKNRKGMGSSLTLDTYVGFSSVPKTLPFLSADEYRKFANDNKLPFPDQGANTNWQDEIYSTGLSQNHNLSYAGGSETSNYRASFGYTDEEGMIIGGGLTKYNGRINTNHKAFDGKLNIDVTMAYSQIENDKKVAEEALVGAYRMAPTLPVRNEDGSYFQVGEQRVNPASFTEITDLTKINMFLGSSSLSYQIMKSLKFNLDLGYSNEANNRFGSIPNTHPFGSNQGGIANISKYQNTTFLTESNLTFDKQITSNSHLTALAGYSFQRFENENTFTEANQFVSTSVTWNLIQSGKTLTNISFKEANRLASYYFRVNYKLMERYLLTATVRRDGSSRFGGNNKWGTFPSGAIAWNMAEESFMEDSKVSNLKLRLGYGITGNQELPNYLYMEQLGISGTSI